MSLTSTEIYTEVTQNWSVANLGLADSTVSVYLTTIQKLLIDLSTGAAQIPASMLYVLSQIWAALRWHAGWAVDTYSGLTPPRPLETELDTYPLAIAGAQWDLMRAGDYVMMANTYSRQLADAWLDDTADLWSAASTEAGQYLFQVCKQYLLRYDALPS